MATFLLSRPRGDLLKRDMSSLQDEISRLTARNQETQQTLERERATFAQDEKMLEDTIVDITNSENRRNVRR